MKVSTKGQVSIPISIRRKAGIVPGCEVEFTEEKGRLYLRVLANSGRGKALVKQMTGQGNTKMSTDEILALTRGKR
jgi:antitoxin PrlF